MKFFSDLFDSAVNVLRNLFIAVSWLTIIYFVWLVIIGLLQTHKIIEGWSVFSLIFDGMPWWCEVLTIIFIPFIAGVTFGLVLYIIYEITFGAKK
jgi:hypothetical protein